MEITQQNPLKPTKTNGNPRVFHPWPSTSQLEPPNGTVARALPWLGCWAGVESSRPQPSPTNAAASWGEKASWGES